MKTWVDVLRQRAEQVPQKTALTFLANGEIEDGARTYADLDIKARAIGACLQASIEAGDRVLLLFPAGLDFISSFFGCLYAGAVALPAYPPRMNRKLARLQLIVEQASPKVVLTQRETYLRIQPVLSEFPLLQSLEWILLEEITDDRISLWQPPSIDEDSLAFLQFTSGSTGDPKGVMVSHANLLDNASMMERGLRVDSDSVYINWCPIYHDMGLIGGTLQPLYNGGSCIAMAPTAFVQDPVRWLRAITKYRGTHSLAPNFAYELCVEKVRDEELDTLDLRSWRIAGNSAEPVRYETLARFSDRFACTGFESSAFCPGYGLAENTLTASMGYGSEGAVLSVDSEALEKHVVIPREAGEAGSKYLVGSRLALDTDQIVIVHPESGKRAAPDEVGEVWLAGKSVAKGYWGRPRETEETFLARLPDSKHAFLRTGDLGFLRNGFVFISGRWKDLVILNGRNHYPQDIELTVETADPVLRPSGGAAFALDVDEEEQLVVVHEVRRTSMRKLDEAGWLSLCAKIRQRVAEEHEVTPWAVVLVREGTVPKTTSGKVQRRKCRIDFQRGDIDALFVSKRDSGVSGSASGEVVPLQTRAEHDVAAVWAEVLKLEVSTIGREDDFFRLGGNSIAATQGASRLMKQRRLDLPPDLFFEYPQLHALAHHLESLGRSQQAASEWIPILPFREKENIPISYEQEILWFQEEMDPGNPAYAETGALFLEGELDLARLEGALAKLVERHHILRTSFHSVGGKAEQKMEPPFSIALVVEDLSEEAKQRRAKAEPPPYLTAENYPEAVRMACALANQPFSLQVPPLFRAAILRESVTSHVLVMAFHHIVVDGGSIPVFVSDLLALYAGRTLPALEVQYADYAVWQRAQLTESVFANELAFWREKLKGFETPLELPSDRARPAVQTYRGGILDFSLSAASTKALRELAEAAGCTLFMVLLAAFKVLLHRYTEQDRIVVGTINWGRKRQELESLVGFFNNTLALPSDLSGNPTFLSFLRSVRSLMAEVQAHQEMPFGKIVAGLDLERDLSRSPIFQVMFVLETPRIREGGSSDGLRCREVSDVDTGAAKFDLAPALLETPDGLVGCFEYNSDLFDATTVARMVRHFRGVLEAIVKSPAARLSEILFTEASEQSWLDRVSHGSHRDYPQELVHGGVEQGASVFPDRIAVEIDGKQLTYSQLNQRANQLAHYLVDKGIRPESIIGLRTERSFEMVVGMLGVLKVGGAYLPIDPELPRERAEYMEKDSGAILVLEGSQWPDLSAYPRENLNISLAPNRLAYVLYTSGSTGRPKGVLVTHGAITNYLAWMHAEFPLTESDVVLQKTFFGFDVSVWEFYAPWRVGAKLLLLKPGAHRDAEHLVNELRIHRVSTLQTVPSQLQVLLREPGISECIDLRGVFSGGEAIPSALWREFQEKLPRTTLYNLYGPTEACLDVTCRACEPGDEAFASVPMGNPIDNLQVYIVDKYLQKVPVGVPGQIAIAGAGLARGYLGRPDLTADRFVPDPFSTTPGDRLYLSGDRARYLADGRIEFVGRVDNQVKVRGLRIELGEIESVLASLRGIATAVVRAIEIQGEKQLVAYCLADKDSEFEEAFARQALRRVLPEYMVPAYFVLLERLPLTQNGKLDTKALPMPQVAAGNTKREPASALESMLLGIWREVLQRESLSIDDSFFRLGGHSLTATQVVSRVRRQFQKEIPLRALFEFPSVAAFARYLNTAEGSTQRKITPVSRDRQIPLSFDQERIWFHEELVPGGCAYIETAVLYLRGRFSFERFVACIDSVVARHEALRTTFDVSEGQPYQVIHPELKTPVGWLDLTHLNEEKRVPEMLRIATEAGQVPFDLKQGPLLRLQVARIHSQEHALLISGHHTFHDGWSIGVVMREIAELYRASEEGRDARLPKLEIQFADFAFWQRERMQGQLLETQLAYWKKTLQDLPTLNLPTDFPRPPVQRFEGKQLEFKLSVELSEKIIALSRESGATVFMTLLAAFNVFLSRHTGQHDIVVGSPFAGQSDLELENLIGFLMNTVVLRNDLSGDPTFFELLARVRSTTLSAIAHKEVPFERLVEALKVPRDISRTPVFQVAFLLENYPIGAQPITRELNMELIELDVGTSKFDLTLDFIEAPDGMLGTFEYSTDLFSTSTIERMVGEFTTLLESIIENPAQRLSNLKMLPDSESCAIDSFSQGKVEAFDVSLVHQGVEKCASLHAERTALSLEEKSWSYRELNSESNRLARYLRAHGVSLESVVAIRAERSFQMVVAMLAILKAGGAYLPVDPEMPVDRQDFLLEDSAAVLVLDPKTWPSYGSFSDADLDLAIAPSNLAYILYTSGSTGRPKGVMVSHGSISNYLAWMQSEFPLVADDKVLQKTFFGFDVSVWEFFAPWRVGAELVLLPPGAHRDAEKVVKALSQHRISSLQTVPSQLQVLLAEPRIRECTSLRGVFSGGEPIPSALCREFQEKLPQATLYNLYGPTEACLDVTCRPCEPRDLEFSTVPMGRPIANLSVHLVDSNLQVVPVGAVGQIAIAGLGLARGYLRRPDLTAERFIPNPFSLEPGSRLYLSGDRGRFLADGRIEFQGRGDTQVKLRGLRIELGEIEFALAELPGVQSAVVRVRNIAGEGRLVAWLVAMPGNQYDEASLRYSLKAKLPEYMVPTQFVLLERLPLTRNGKLDEAALPTPEGKEAPGVKVGPRNPREAQLISIWSDVLKEESLGIDDDFFHCGGHSLSATRAMSRVRKAFQVEVALRAIFEFPTVRLFSDYLDRLSLEVSRPSLPEIVPYSRTAPLPLSFSQERIWFLDQMEPGNSHYNIPVTLRLQGNLSERALERAVAQLVNRHEVLRSVVRVNNGKPVQVASDIPIVMSRLDLSTEANPSLALESRVQADMQRGFDLATGPLVRVFLFRLQPNAWGLHFTIHHLAFDEWSLDRLQGELFDLYLAEVEGRAHSLPELPIQYADFSAWQREVLSEKVLEPQLEYWTRKLENLPTLELTTDFPRPPVQTFRGRDYVFSAPAELNRIITALGEKASASQFMTYLAAFKLLLRTYTQSDDLVVGTPIANRTRVEVEPLIGLFLNVLTLRTDLAQAKNFGEVVERVRSACMEAFAHQDIPFERLVESLQPKRDLSRSPFFQTLFVFHRLDGTTVRLPGIEAELVDFPSSISKFDLSLYMTERADGSLTAYFEYNTDLFSEASIAQFAEHFVHLLEQIAKDPSASLNLVQAPPLSSAVWTTLHPVVTRGSVQKSDFFVASFERQVRSTPQSCATEFEGHEVSYDELNRSANRLAHALRELGVGRDSVVGIVMDRSQEMVQAILGVMKAGAAYAPIDPEYPVERVRQIVQDANPKVLLTQAGLVQDLETIGIPCVAADLNGFGSYSDADLNLEILPNQLAYIVFTSGSTGRPKGAMNTHLSLANCLRWMQETYPLDESHRVAQKTPYTFDVSILEFLCPLVAGARLVIARPGGHQDPAYLAKLISSRRVTLVHFVPSMLRAFLQHPAAASCTTLKAILCIGESLPADLAVKCQELLPASLHNMYGPAEAAIHVTHWQCTNTSTRAEVPIGKPIEGVAIYVLDEGGEVCALGVPGELCIGGISVGRGYVGAPELTAARFVPDPFSEIPGSRMYRTGDRARWTREGLLQFLGRVDFQVKVRGFRIEPEEIESVLARAKGVRASAVVAQGDRLIAFVCRDPALSASNENLRGLLAANLPEYMIPSLFHDLVELPLGTSGKVDRKKLGELARALGIAKTEKSNPSDTMEHALAEIWAEVLSFPPAQTPGIDDVFFELGGHSLLLASVQAHLSRRLQREVPIVALFQYPTIRSLARYLNAGNSVSASVDEGVERAKRRKRDIPNRRRPS